MVLRCLLGNPEISCNKDASVLLHFRNATVSFVNCIVSLQTSEKRNHFRSKVTECLHPFSWAEISSNMWYFWTFDAVNPCKIYFVVGTEMPAAAFR